MPYVVRLLLAQRVADWQARLDRLGAYLARALPTKPVVKRKARRKKV